MLSLLPFFSPHSLSCQWNPFSLASHQHLLYDDPLIDHSCFGQESSSSVSFFTILHHSLISMFSIPTLPCLTSPSSFSSAFPLKGMSISPLPSCLFFQRNVRWWWPQILISGRFCFFTLCSLHSFLFLCAFLNLTLTIISLRLFNSMCVFPCLLKREDKSWVLRRDQNFAGGLSFLFLILPCFPVHLESWSTWRLEERVHQQFHHLSLFSFQCFFRKIQTLGV